MEIRNDYYESLLDDPVDTPVEETVEEPTVEEPILPDQPDSDEPEPAQTPDNTEDDLITSYLKSHGIADPTKIQFENEEGGIDEVDFSSLSKDEQLTMLQELGTSNYTDYEKSVIDYLRVNKTDLQGVIDYFSNKAVEEYGTDKMIDVIDYSIANNYQGIVFDRLKNIKPSTNNSNNQKWEETKREFMMKND